MIMPFSHCPYPPPGAESPTHGSVATRKANMTDHLSHHDDDDIEWTEATSKNGKPFLVGVKKTEAKGHREDSKSPSALTKYNCFVNWPVDGEAWLSSPSGLRLYISQYRLYRTSIPFFDYRLDIKSVVNYDVKYTFYDESGDYYTLRVYRSGEHYVLYKSANPTITEVVIEVL